MKAIVYSNYGAGDAIRCEEIAKPVAGDGGVLIRVGAASVNALDYHLQKIRRHPLLRTAARLLGRRISHPGSDVAGTVEEVGKNVTRFRPGAEVFGVCRGSFAEYVRASDSALVAKPPNVTFEQAASTSLAALTALQGLRDKGRIQPGQKVLVNGAAGGVGTFAVQIARAFGAAVTAATSTHHLDLVRSLGAERVIDYTKEDFTRNSDRYDLVLDCHATRSIFASRRALNPNGRYVIVGGPVDSILRVVSGTIATAALSRLVRQTFVTFMTEINQPDLITIAGMLQSGRLTPVIDRCYALREAAQAVAHVEQGRAAGKVVITVSR